MQAQAHADRVFNISRIPLANSDAFSTSTPKATHLTLMIEDFIYSVDVFGPPSSNDGVSDPLPVAEIERRLAAAVADAHTRRNNGEESTMIGLLTADERDTWMNVSSKKYAV